MAEHGDKRVRVGRPKMLQGEIRRLSVSLSADQYRKLKKIRRKHNLRSLAEAVRRIIDRAEV